MLEDNTKEILENQFMDNFGMTLDQFERLDFETQDALIKKALILNKKKKRLAETKKINLKEVLSYYPIFRKVLKKK